MAQADKELKDMAELELSELKTEFEINEKKLKLFLLPKDEADKKNAIIEIRAGNWRTGSKPICFRSF
jgi:peptide chain release factor 1